MIRQRFAAHAGPHSHKVNQILLFALQLKAAVGKSGEGLQAHADMRLQRLAVWIHIQALLIGDPYCKLPSRFIVPREHLGNRNVLWDRHTNSTGLHHRTDHLSQGLPSILEGLTSALLIRKAGICTRRNQKFLILGGMLQLQSDCHAAEHRAAILRTDRNRCVFAPKYILLGHLRRDDRSQRQQAMSIRHSGHVKKKNLDTGNAKYKF